MDKLNRNNVAIAQMAATIFSGGIYSLKESVEKAEKIYETVWANDMSMSQK